MYFGATTFAEDCFGAQGVPNTVVEVSGIALSMNAGSSAQTADANVSLTGTAMAFSINGVTVTADANVVTTAAGLTSSVGIANGIGWATVSTGTGQTWTLVSTGTGQTWVPVDEVEKVA